MLLDIHKNIIFKDKYDENELTKTRQEKMVKLHKNV